MYTVEYDGFIIKLDGRFSLYSIHRSGSGKLPRSLVGNFTDTKSAKFAIDTYLSGKGKLNANTDRLVGG